jgi:hypothetical protein
MTDSSVITVTRVRSLLTDGQAIADLQVNNTGSDVGWSGAALVSTRVEMTATVGGKDTTAMGTFTVQSRIGRLQGWMDAGLPDTGFAVTPPSPHYDTTSPTVPPFDQPYPGFNTNNDTLAYHGAVGKTVFPYPRQPAIVAPRSGPNAGIGFFQAVIWMPDGRYGGHPAGIHLQGSMQSTDPFYKAQRGPDPFCSKQKFNDIHTVVLSHEQRHWNLTRPLFQAANVQGIIESVVVLPGETTDLADSAWTRVAQAYAAAADTGAAKTHAEADTYPSCQLRPL